MSFKSNQHQQLTLSDSFINQTPRTQKIIMNSWCKDFADIVFSAINEERFSVLYSNNKFSRPNTPVNVIVGAMMLKENNNLTDTTSADSTSTKDAAVQTGDVTNVWIWIGLAITSITCGASLNCITRKKRK